MAALIVTGVFRYSDEGEACAMKDIPIGVDSDTTFKDHGEMIEGLFISQCVLVIFLQVCIVFSLCLACTLGCDQ